MTTLFICGAGNPEGVRLALAINAKETRWDKILVLDDDPSQHGKTILGVEVAGPFDLLAESDPKTAEVANMVARTTAKRWAARQKIAAYGLPFATLVHPGVDTTGVTLGEDITVYTNAILCANASVSEGSVVFTGAVVGHGCRLGRCCVVAPGAVINARVQVGDGVYIGTNASILPDLNIGRDTTIGANSAVIQDVPDEATAMGVPAELVMSCAGQTNSRMAAAQNANTDGTENASGDAKSSMEKELIQIWSRALKVENIGLHDNFFDLGADSVLAIQIMARAKQAGISFSVRQLLERPTVAGLAEVATRIDGERTLS